MSIPRLAPTLLWYNTGGACRCIEQFENPAAFSDCRTKIRTYEEARILISAYIHFYNNERIQLKTKLTPLEKRCQFVA